MNFKLVLLLLASNTLVLATDLGLGIAPSGSTINVCSRLFLNGEEGKVEMVVKPDDLILIIDHKNHLLRHAESDFSLFQELIRPRLHLKDISTSPGVVELINIESNLYGSVEHGMDYIYLLKAKELGQTKFMVSRFEPKMDGRQKMSEQDQQLLDHVIDFQEMLLTSHGSEPTSFEDYMRARVDLNALKPELLIELMATAEEESARPLKERVELSKKAVEFYRDFLAPKIVESEAVPEFQQPIKVTKSARRDVLVNKLHQVMHDKLPTHMDVELGDVIALQSIRPKSTLVDGLTVSYEMAQVYPENLLMIHGEKLSNAGAEDNFRVNEAKAFFYADTVGPAKLVFYKAQPAGYETGFELAEKSHEIIINVKWKK